MAIFTIFVMCTSGPYLEGGRITKNGRLQIIKMHLYMKTSYGGLQQKQVGSGTNTHEGGEKGCQREVGEA